MGWFDKKSWQLRRKIRDLQSELAVAERNGQFVVEQGLFFAELQEMGDNTMMVLGAADHLDAGEEEIIRNFFDRNGFTVDTLRLDKDQKSLSAVEIFPPEELVKHVARKLQENGYRIIDDSEQIRPADLDKKMFTLSSLLRATTAIFSAHVNHMIVSTPIKLNMEGNRLLHWMPLVRDGVLQKVPLPVVKECVSPFIDGYNHYYGQFGTIRNPDELRSVIDSLDDQQATSPAAAPIRQEVTSSSAATPSTGTTFTTRAGGAAASASATASALATPPATPVLVPTAPDRASEASRTLAHMYRSLIGASDQRKVRNAETLLEQIGRFYGAKSTCIIRRDTADSPLRLHANSGTMHCVATSEDGTVTCESDVIDRALQTNKPALSQPHGNGNSNTEAIALPLELPGNSAAVLYMLEPSTFSASTDSHDMEYLIDFGRIFREYPDLLI